MGMAGLFTPHATSEVDKKAMTVERFGNWISGFYEHEGLDTPRPIYGVEPSGFGADVPDNGLIRRSYEPTLVPLGFLWGLDKSAQKRWELAREAIEQIDIPIAMAWNGETASYIVSAVKAGEALGTKV